MTQKKKKVDKEKKEVVEEAPKEEYLDELEKRNANPTPEDPDDWVVVDEVKSAEDHFAEGMQLLNEAMTSFLAVNKIVHSKEFSDSRGEN